MINYIHDTPFEICKFHFYVTWITLERNVHPPIKNVLSRKLHVQKQTTIMHRLLRIINKGQKKQVIRERGFLTE